MLDIGSIRDELSPIFEKYDVNSAVLFGSYAKMNARDNSDVDILVDSGLKGLAFFGLLEDIVNTLGKSVDLIDITQVDPDSKVMNEINQTGVVIYGSKDGETVGLKTGALAQLGERQVRNLKARGSIPLCSI